MTTAATVREVVAVVGKMKAAFTSGDDLQCEEHLGRLKQLFILLPTFLDPAAASPTRAQEVALVREVLEHAVLLAARMKDLDLFEAYYAQVCVYYDDIQDPEVPASERRLLVVGLNLLRLLVSNRISEFHTQLERIPIAEHSNLFVKTPVLLERYLMEGSYNKLLTAKAQVPSNEFVPVMELLEDAVRADIAACVPLTYPKLSLAECRKLLLFASDDAVVEFAKQRGWPAPVAGSFSFSTADDTAARKEIPFRAQLTEHISLAAALQQVV